MQRRDQSETKQEKVSINALRVCTRVTRKPFFGTPGTQKTNYYVFISTKLLKFVAEE